MNNTPLVTYSITAQNSNSSVALTGTVPPDVINNVKAVTLDSEKIKAIQADDTLSAEDKHEQIGQITSEYQTAVKTFGSYTGQLVLLSLQWVEKSYNENLPEEANRVVLKGISQANIRANDLVVDPASCQISKVADADGNDAYRISGTVVFG